ncbi:Phosphoinositide phosphatase SAC6 protein [Dioscorea alata]|uniref:Phosphoinositide phosphatase SAC6 protein n=1 Tax=Dioscorea alata TaxID=55571 RepID=A0ACB7WUG1_DIOAL|nr:Phosphoinositide phosphatase SAC6 protein [Dioscorea alata]
MFAGKRTSSTLPIPDNSSIKTPIRSIGFLHPSLRKLSLPLLSLPATRSFRSLSFSIRSPSPISILSQSLDRGMDGVESDKKLFTRLRLWEFPDRYVFENADGVADSYLSISRADGSMELIGDLPQCATGQSPKVRTVYGLIGVQRILVGSYLLVIAQRECVGSYLGHAIYKVSRLEILPCNLALKSTDAAKKKMETEFSMLLNAAEGTSGLYFSYDINLTLCAQRLHDLGDESKKLPLWRQADPRFLWNSYMLEPLIDNNLDPYLLPVIQGSFQNFQAAVRRDIINVTLIARRCTRRTGTRMWRRGADSDGYVANFVETEQIVQWNGFSASFVQVRGSIPLLWEQIVDLTYKPSFELVKAEEAPRVAERHFLDLSRKYGSVLAVDLVNKHGSEGRLGEKFANAMQNLGNDNIRYVQFDFHRICGHIHFERLSLLYEQIEEYLKNHGYFLLNEKGEKVKEQTGVVRTNCIDCLDRTNVTQSMVGRKMLESQLHQIRIFGADETIGSHPDFDASFKILWANHGDEISIQYSGTPALKGDFVRYGKRTVQGILNDGWNALARYYYNNFADGTKQDAMDLLQGHYIVSVNRDMAFPAQPKGLEAFASFRLAMVLVLAGLLFAFMSLRQARHDFRYLFFPFFWASLSLGLAAFVRANGRIFTNRPRLFRSRHWH